MLLVEKVTFKILMLNAYAQLSYVSFIFALSVA